MSLIVARRQLFRDEENNDKIETEPSEPRLSEPRNARLSEPRNARLSAHRNARLSEPRNDALRRPRNLIPLKSRNARPLANVGNSSDSVGIAAMKSPPINNNNNNNNNHERVTACNTVNERQRSHSQSVPTRSDRHRKFVPQFIYCDCS